jgi:hypothetical protein
LNVKAIRKICAKCAWYNLQIGFDGKSRIHWCYYHRRRCGEITACVNADAELIENGKEVERGKGN